MASSNVLTPCKKGENGVGKYVNCADVSSSKEILDINEDMNWESISQSLIFSGIQDQVELDQHQLGTGDPGHDSQMVFSNMISDRKEGIFMNTDELVNLGKLENADNVVIKTHDLVNLESSQRHSNCPLSEMGNIDLLNEYHCDDISVPDSPEEDSNVLETISLQNLNRMKSRFQEPSPLTSAIKSQLTYCNSTVMRRRTADPTSVEPETYSTDLPSSNLNPVSQNETEPKNESYNTPTLVHSFSSSKCNPNTVANAEEEPDPFSDAFVPEENEEKESKWFTCLQWFSLFALTALLVCSVEIRELEQVLFLGLNLWRWQALALVILCGHLISGWIMKLLVVLIERHYLLKKKVLYFVYGLRNCVKNSIWLALVVGVWGVIFQGHEHTTAVSIVSKILWCMFTASVSWMVKVLLVKVAASNFHRTAYFEKIQGCLFNQYLLEKLSGPPTMAHVFTTEENKNTYSGSRHRKHRRGSTGSLQSDSSVPENELLWTQSDVGSTTSWRRAFNYKLTSYWRKSGSSGTLGESDDSFRSKSMAQQHSVISMSNSSTATDISKQALNDSTFSSQVPYSAKSSNTVQHEKLQGLTSETVSVWTLKRLMKIVRSTNLKTYSSMLSHEKQDTVIDSEAQAKVVAKQIFLNMTRPGQKCITMTNFLYFLDKDQALKAFSMFDTTETGEITKQAFAKWVVNAYKDRRALCLTLSDNKTIIEKLHTVLNWVLGVILIAAFVLIFGVDTSKVLLFISSIILPSVFMFGNAAKILFESLIFLFVTHPFDVGDRISIDGQPMVVEEMNILHTILLSPSNEKIYYPNFLLAGKPISNFYRSPDQWDSIDFQIHVKTPLEKLTLLKERIQKYVEGLPQFWYPEFRISCKDIEDSNKMKMGMWLRHRLNFQEGAERLQRRSSVLLFLKQQLEELDISYQLPSQEIMVTGIPSLSNF